jgi:2-methylcitrate dehydratase PrpD
VTLVVDPELEALGYDQVRSRVRVALKNGRTVEGRADVARGHPDKPMGWDELADKFRDCCRLVPGVRSDEAIGIVADLDRLKSIAPLIRALGGSPKAAKRPGEKKWTPARRK